MSIAENVARIRRELQDAAIAAGRDPAQIQICAATKMNDSDAVRQAIAAGVDCCGENRVQELVQKQGEDAYAGAPVHFIGHLQTNKVKYIADKVYMIHSLDSEKLAAEIDMERFLERDVNVGFSGGEIKRSELLQLSAQCPDMFLLDEPESGVDPVNMAQVGGMIRKLLAGDQKCCVHAGTKKNKSALIITHTGEILDYFEADKAYILCNGTIMCSGNPRIMLNEIKTQGYEECIGCKLNLTNL